MVHLHLEAKSTRGRGESQVKGELHFNTTQRRLETQDTNSSSNVTSAASAPPLFPFSLWKVQRLLGLCANHLEKGESHQAPTVLGIALVAMAEELGLDMAIHLLEHLLQYGEQDIRRVVPLALGILSISNPKLRF
ncbi:unnamed protein product [Calypogeia fissa]